MKIAIIILNYNGLKQTIDCINSVKKLDKGANSVEIVVVDNNSSDQSQVKLPKIKGIDFLQNHQNLGYSGGNNVGIIHSLKKHADLILILNNDTVVDKELLTHLLDTAKSADIISPKIYFAPGFEFHKNRYGKKDIGKVIWYAGAHVDWENIIGKHIGVDEVDKGRYNKRRETDFATGACMFVKSEVFESIGFFDEKYFLYLEDMDFSLRAEKAGFKIVFEPRAIIWHKNAQSAKGSGSNLQDYYITRNRLLFAFKYAKLKTKMAVLKQTITQVKNKARRRALVDFIFGNLGKGTFLS